MSGRPIVIAHRGGAAEAPENTMEAFERAIQLGYPGVEFDVRCSQDGVPVVVHDDLPVAELAAFPRLDSVLALPWGRMTLMVEVKPTTDDAYVGAAVARAIVAGALESQAIVASFSADVLRSVFKAAPLMRLMALLDDETYYKNWADFEGLPFFGFGVDFGLLEVDRGLLKWLRQRGGQVWTWTIKNLGQMRRALRLGVDGLITDIPGEVLKHLQ